ncbi:MAG: hypothetical protein ACOWWM_09700 [Desulfobacterales bacterium]
MSDPILEYEAGQTQVAATALAEQSDHKTFKSSAQLWSQRSGFAAAVMPNGVKSGLVVGVAASGSNDVVDISAGKCYLAGAEVEVDAAVDQAIARPTVSNYQIYSITVNAAGAIAVVEGAEGTSFAAGRGEDGGPPWIPTTSIEIAQVKLSSQDAAAIAASEIVQVDGDSRERYNYPVWDVYPYVVEDGAIDYAKVVFASALPQIHSDDAGSSSAAKKIYASYSTPAFSQVQISKDFVPPEEGVSISSEEYYGKSVGKVTRTLNQGSFTAKLSGLTDPLYALKGESLFFRFYPDRLEDEYILCQGYLGVPPTFETDGGMLANCVIAAELAAERVVA